MKAKHSPGKLFFTILCILLSISFFLLLLVGWQEFRLSGTGKSFYEKTDYQRALVEEKYGELYNTYTRDHYANSSSINQELSPVVQYYEAAFLVHAFHESATEAQEATFTEKLKELEKQYPSYETHFSKIKNLLGI